jgi:membrane associated rhomboid family serine protease
MNPTPWAWWWAVALALGAPALLIGWAPLDTPADTWPAWQAALALHPPQGWAQAPWRWWTCAWLHGSAAHQLGNMLAVLAVAALGQQGRMPRRAAIAWALAWPLTHLALLGQPQPVTYVGASGVLHAGVAILGVYHLLDRHEGAQQMLGPLLLGGLALKVFMENPWQHNLITHADSAITVAP